MVYLFNNTKTTILSSQKPGFSTSSRESLLSSQLFDFWCWKLGHSCDGFISRCFDETESFRPGSYKNHSFVITFALHIGCSIEMTRKSGFSTLLWDLRQAHNISVWKHAHRLDRFITEQACYRFSTSLQHTHMRTIVPD